MSSFFKRFRADRGLIQGGAAGGSSGVGGLIEAGSLGARDGAAACAGVGVVSGEIGLHFMENAIGVHFIGKRYLFKFEMNKKLPRRASKRCKSEGFESLALSPGRASPTLKELQVTQDRGSEGFKIVITNCAQDSARKEESSGSAGKENIPDVATLDC